MAEVRKYFEEKPFTLNLYREISGSDQKSTNDIYVKLMSLRSKTNVVFSSEEIEIAYNIMQKLAIKSSTQELAPRAMEVVTSTISNISRDDKQFPLEDQPSLGMVANSPTIINREFKSSSWHKIYSSGLRRVSEEVRDKTKLYEEFLSKIREEREESERQESERHEPERQESERQDKLKKSLEGYFNIFNSNSSYEEIVKMKKNFPDPRDGEMSKDISGAFLKMNQFIVQRNKDITFSTKEMQIIEFSLDKAKDLASAPQTKMQNSPNQSRFIRNLLRVGSEFDPNKIIRL